MRRARPAPPIRPARPALAPPVLLATLAACGGGDAVVGVIRADSAGVEIVTSPPEDRPLAWTFEEELRLGGADDGPESFSSVNFDQVGADGAGDLYVLDRPSHRVVVFGPDGSHLRSMGAEGEGPGELRFPLSLAVREDGTAAVFDLGKGGMVLFGPDAGILPQQPFGLYTEPGTLRHFALTPVGYAVARGRADEAADSRTIELLSWRAGDVAADTAILTELALPAAEMADFGCMRIALPPLFTPFIQWDSEGSEVAAIGGVSYRVDVFGLDGTLRRSIRRDLPVRAATGADAVAEAGPGLRMRSSAGGCEATPEEVVEERGFASELPAIRTVLMAPSGEIWVQRLVPGSLSSGAPAPIDVFDPSGAYLGTLPAGTPFPLLILPDGRIVFEDKDALDVERLVIARVERGTSADGSG